MSRPRVGLARGALLLAAALALGGCPADPDAGSDGAAAQDGPVADPAPDFTLEQLGGGSITLSSLRGRTVVIDFWATWCPPCEFQVPELNAFYQAHLASGQVEVLGVSVDTEGPEVVEAWIEEKGVEYPILLGSAQLAREFGAVGFPTLAVVDPEGNIASRHVGLIERDDLEEELAHVQQRFGGEETAQPAEAPEPAPSEAGEPAPSQAEAI
ncbi:MAG: TlpA family protein disulfide reductase [Myxococcota bacterium]